MLMEVEAGPYHVRGISVGGIYTSLHVRELDVTLDVGLAPRSFAGTGVLLLSHGHADHAGALATLLGVRMLCCGNRRLDILLPAPIVEPVRAVLEQVSELQRNPVNVALRPMSPGDEVSLGADLHVRAFRTYHPVASLGYLFIRRVDKLRHEFHGMPGPEIKRRRLAGENLFDRTERLELAYATDTLPRVLEDEPALFRVNTLILECTFLDDKKSPADAHSSCHIHLDDLLTVADRFANQAVLLMHFSQVYRPRDVHDILARRCPLGLRERLVVFAPQTDSWPG
jgi:ribonuclease Z